MPYPDGYEPGTPCWVDLMSPDVDASTAFYTSLFGWEATDELDDEGNRIYVTLTRDGRQAAGVGGMPPSLPEGVPPAWNTYVATDDPDAAAARVEAAGGSVAMPPMDIMGAGTMAVFTDPTGAVFSVWKAGRHHGAEVVNEPNAYSWNELVTSDLDGASAFYAEVFGWDYDDMAMPSGTYRIVRGGQNGLAGLMTKPADMTGVPDYWGVYMTVADAKATLDRAAELGANVLFGPDPAPGVGILGAFIDPQGAMLSIMQPESAS